MDKTSQEQVIDIIREKFESDVLSIQTPYDFLTIDVRKENIIDLIRYLYDHPVAKFQYLTTLCGVHYPDMKQKLADEIEAELEMDAPPAVG